MTAPEWREDAACVGITPDIFFLPSTERDAIKICQTCPVRQACLDDAMTNERADSDRLRYGIYGGLTPKQRAQLDQPTRNGKPIPPDCAEPSRHVARAHRRNGEPPCRACNATEADYLRDLRARTRATA